MSVESVRDNQRNIDIPISGFTIARPALHNVLAESVGHLLTLVSAPPGYGKTTTVAQYVRHSPVPTAWHSLQERERDLNALYKHSLQALEFVAPGICNTADDLTTSEECAGYIADYLREHVSEHIFYVLDDLQFIVASAQAERWLRDLVRLVPTNCHLILISRALPDLPLAELIAKGDVLAIGQDQLRFTVDDARVLAQQMAFALPDVVLEERIQQLEGWPVGVAMSLRPLPSDLQVGMLRGSGGPEGLFNALATRILDVLSPVLVDFLLTASIVAEITPQICDEVLQISNSAAFITEIMNRNLFASRVAGGLTLHRLFRGFLQEHLRQTHPEHFVQLHMRAGDWHREHHDDDEALQHYLSADNIEAALAVVRSAHRTYFTQGNLETLLRWRMTLGEHAENIPEFIYTCALILTNRYLYDDALAELNCAEAGFVAAGGGQWVAEVQLQRAMIHIWLGEYALALALAGPVSTDETLKPTTVGRARHLLAVVDMETGQLERAIENLQAVLWVFEAVNEFNYVSAVLQDLQVAYTRAGDMSASSYYLQRLVSMRRMLGKSSELALALNNLGDHYHQLGDYGLALQTLDEGLRIVEQTANRRAESYLYWTMGDLQRDLGRVERTRHFYERAYELSSGSEPLLQQSIMFSMVVAYRRQEEYQLALRLIRDLMRKANVNPAGAMGTLLHRATEATLTGLAYDMPEAMTTIDALLGSLDDEAVTIEKVQMALMGAQLATHYEDDERLWVYLAVCKGAYERGIGHSFIAAEIISWPKLRKKVESNKRFRSFATLVQHLHSVRQLHTPDDKVGKAPPVVPTYNLRVLTLGTVSVERDGDTIENSEWRSSKAKEFFFYLLFNGASRREDISLCFWPDSSISHVRSNFHTTLYRARSALGENVILFEDERYFINPSVRVWCDAKIFSDYVRQAQVSGYSDVRADELYRQALSYYRGDFLPMMDAEWIDTQRIHLHEQYIQALIGSGHCARTRREFDAALSRFNEALTIDPYREDAYRASFTCYANMGERNLLLTQYKKMIRFFEAELGVLPSPETYAHVQQLTQAPR